jgi:peptidoglycan/LPS O-acetylase OafA/YrhL
VKQAQRIYGLDILRATAILLVIIFHSGAFISPYTGMDFFRALPDGVSLFFVLSGFLIGRILLDIINTTEFSFRQLKFFWFRRWLRTLPAYYVVLFLLIAYHMIMKGEHEPWQYLKHFFFVQNISYGSNNFFSESWSLSVEEWFYLIIPFILFISVYFFPGKRKLIGLLWIIFLIATFSVVRIIRSEDIANYAQWNHVIRKPVITRFDSIMVGFLGAFLYYYKFRIWENKRFLFFSGILLIILPAVVFLISEFNWFTIYLRIPLESMGTLLLLPALTDYKTGKGMLFKFFSFTSLISYSIYLLNYTPFNQIVLPRLTGWFGLPADQALPYDLIRLAVFLVWSFAAAWLLYLFVERPFMQFGKKFRTGKQHDL